MWKKISEHKRHHSVHWSDQGVASSNPHVTSPSFHARMSFTSSMMQDRNFTQKYHVLLMELNRKCWIWKAFLKIVAATFTVVNVQPVLYWCPVKICTIRWSDLPQWYSLFCCERNQRREKGNWLKNRNILNETVTGLKVTPRWPVFVIDGYVLSLRNMKDSRELPGLWLKFDNNNIVLDL